MPKTVKVRWSRGPADHDFPAALSYLCLIHDPKASAAYVNRLRRASISQFKAKDIFRASGLPLLGSNNSHVARDREKIEAGEALSPLLLVRDSDASRVIIADGYHRLCAVYSYDEDAVIPCKIV